MFLGNIRETIRNREFSCNLQMLKPEEFMTYVISIAGLNVMF